MPKKTKVKTKEEGEKPSKAVGGKPIKVVTFDTPDTEHPEQAELTGWETPDADKAVENGEPLSGSRPWGENTVGGGGRWDNQPGWRQPTPGWSSPTPEPLPVPPPVPPDARSPPPSSPPPPPPSVPPHTATKDNNPRMPNTATEEPPDEIYTWGANQTSTNQHQWGSPLSNATTPLGLTSPSAEPQSLAAAAEAVRTMKTNSASDAARRMAGSSAPTQPPPAPPAPAPPATGAHGRSQSESWGAQAPSSQQWTGWSKSTPAPLPTARHGNRDDYAIAAAALERDLRKAATAAGHYNPGRGHTAQHSDHGWDTPKGSAWAQPGKASNTGWGQAAGSEPWGSHKDNDTGWGSAGRHRRSGAGWGAGSDAGFSNNGPSLRRGRQLQAQPSKHHKETKSWEAWGRQRSDMEAESEGGDEDGEWEEEEDLHDSGWGRSSQQDHGWGGNRERASWGKDTSGWNKSGDTGWGASGGGGGWDQPQGGTDWGTQQSSWGENKVITDPPENVGSRNVLSPQQRSQILNSLLNLPQGQRSGADSKHGGGKKHKSEHSNGWSQPDGWGNDAGWGPIAEEDETDSEDDHRQSTSKRNDPWNTSINDSSYTMPSKTLAYAYKDTKTSLHTTKPRDSMHDYTSVQFVESQGAALKPVQQALFGKARWAKDRIHWMFPPDKDQRVSMLLAWIESMSYNLGTFGLHKFLQSRERGALVTNADFRLPQFPGQPVFDWLTFDQLQGTMDKIMQESAVFYDPATQVIVFVLLPSKSGNSVAMWRRKIKVPNNTRLMYQEHITQAVAALKKEKDYVVYVDRLPLKPENSQTPQMLSPRLAPKVPSKLMKAVPAAAPKKKRKWWHIFTSS